MKNIQSIDQFMMQMMNVVNQLCTHGETITDKKVLEKVIISLQPKFDMEVTIIE